MIFGKKDTKSDNSGGRIHDFSYVEAGQTYMDTACQTPRPQPVIDALTKYYTAYNACGGRVKYDWGRKVDEAIEDTRTAILQMLKLPPQAYSASFTLNTTYGLNILLQQLPQDTYDRIVTSDIEHNSVFLSTITAAKRLGIERLVLERDQQGALQYDPSQLKQSVVVVNVVSNIDGRKLINLQQLITDVHEAGGVIILDAAQAMAHSSSMLENCNADAICFSAHKMYAPSLGIVIAKKEFSNTLDFSFVGGGMVSSVSEQSFELTPNDLESRFEPGLQAYGEIIALGKAIRWLDDIPAREARIARLSDMLFDGLKEIESLKMINSQASPVVSVYSEKHDSHRLATFLSSAGIMARSGYFCCHYYLMEKKQLPPLLRFSIGLHTTEVDVQKTIDTMKKLMKGL